MIRKVELGIVPKHPFAEPSPLGLIVLAIACAALILFVDFLPLWTPWMLRPEQYTARMWLHGPGPFDWR